MPLIDKYGPPKELWPIIKLDFPEAKNWPQKLNIAEILVDENVRLGRGGKTAILHENQVITYGELQLNVNRFGNALKSLGMEIGDRIVICLPNIPEFVISHLAIQKIGCVSVPIHPLLRAKEISYIVNNCEAKAIISGSQIIGELEKSRNELKTVKYIILVKVGHEEFKFPFFSFDELMEEFRDKTMLESVRVDQGEIALLQYTSGTTGLPKGCIHTHRDYLVAGECFAKKVIMSNEKDVWGGPVSLAFSFGHNSMITSPMFCGGSSSLFGDKRFDPILMFELIEKHKISILCAVPTAYRSMVSLKEERGKYDFSSLRVCITGGEPYPPSLYWEIKNFFGCEVLNHIGSTELHYAFISARFGQVKPGSLGLPVPGYEVKIFSDDGRELPVNEVGRLAVIGPTGTLYWRREAEQAEAVKGGWNYTGDLAYRDSDGFFWFVSRGDDIIKTSGYRVSPHEVEEALTKHPAVLEAGVVGAPDPERGQIIKAFVVLKPDFVQTEELKEEIRKFVKDQIAPYKVPREITFTKELPKTETGKIKRSELRRLIGKTI
ncbi:MAG: acyl-CoA synthetase [Candidatus Bathyarchaeia archaeon]